MEPNKVFYNDLWNYRTIQLGLIESEPNQFDAGKINRLSITSLNTKLKGFSNIRCGILKHI